MPVIRAKQMHEWHIQRQTNDGPWEIPGPSELRVKLSFFMHRHRFMAAFLYRLSHREKKSSGIDQWKSHCKDYPATDHTCKRPPSIRKDPFAQTESRQHNSFHFWECQESNLGLLGEKKNATSIQCRKLWKIVNCNLSKYSIYVVKIYSTVDVVGFQRFMYFF